MLSCLGPCGLRTWPVVLWGPAWQRVDTLWAPPTMPNQASLFWAPQTCYQGRSPHWRLESRQAIPQSSWGAQAALAQASLLQCPQFPALWSPRESRLSPTPVPVRRPSPAGLPLKHRMLLPRRPGGSSEEGCFSPACRTAAAAVTWGTLVGCLSTLSLGTPWLRGQPMRSLRPFCVGMDPNISLTPPADSGCYGGDSPSLPPTLPGP